MSENLVVVGSISNACRSWHLAAGAIFSAKYGKYGVKFIPKPRPSQDSQEDRNGGGKRESAS